MLTYIAKAIKENKEVILTLKDNSKISGLPSWGEDHSRVKIKSPDKGAGMQALKPLTRLPASECS